MRELTGAEERALEDWERSRYEPDKDAPDVVHDAYE